MSPLGRRRLRGAGRRIFGSATRRDGALILLPQAGGRGSIQGLQRQTRIWVTRFLPVLLVAAWAWKCPAQEAPEFGPDLTAEQLLDAWLGEGSEVPPVEPARGRGKLDLRVHGGAGYKKNVAYSAVHPLDSAFSVANAELSLDRQFPEKGEIYLYAYGEQHHYFELDRSEDDQSATAEFAWVAHPGRVDTLQLTGNYYYIDQFFDASLSDIEVDSYRLREHDAGAQALTEKQLSTKWSVRLEGGYQEVMIHESNDDYSEWDVQAGADCTLDRLTLISAEFQRGFEDYHDRPKRDPLGDPLASGTIDLAEESLTLKLRRYLDRQRAWQVRLRGSVTARDDNAGGYYDYLGWRGRLQLRYERDAMSLECGFGYNYLDYDERPAQPELALDETLYRAWWIAWLRAEYAFRPPWSVFAEACYEDYDSNDPLSVYDHSWTAAGIGVAF